MAKHDVVVQLIRAHYENDAVAFSRAATDLIRQEEAKKNLAVAEAYREALRPRSPSSGQSAPAALTSVVETDPRFDMLMVEYSNPGLSSVVLPAAIQSQISALISEWKQRAKLLKFGIHPRTKVLLYGPPGCGKTATATAIAGELGLPLVVVRFDSLVSSFLGQTGNNIKRVFDYTRNTQCVLFMDEFDAIAKMRDDQKELGELKRVVITLLQNIDYMGTRSMFVAATNHAQLLDNALWRRFDLLCKLDLPSKQERVAILKNKCSALAIDETVEYDTLGALTEGFSGADLCQVVDVAWRKAILTDSTSKLGTTMLEEAAKHAAAHGLLNQNEAFTWAQKLRTANSHKYSYATLESLLGIPHSTLHARLSKEKAEVAAETPPTSGNPRAPGKP